MARQGIFTGTSPNDGTGDPLILGAKKVNDNFSEIYSALGDGNTLLNGNPNLTVGFITSTGAEFTGGVTIGGTLTYEDVTNIDSVGLITARSGIEVTSGNIDISSGQFFVGAGFSVDRFGNSVTSGISTFESNIDANGTLDVDGKTFLDEVVVSEGLSITGVTTVGSSVTITPSGIDITGILTASSGISTDSSSSSVKLNIVGSNLIIEVAGVGIHTLALT